MSSVIEVQARSGTASRVGAGQSIRVVNAYGGQVIDLWAFWAERPDEYMFNATLRRCAWAHQAGNV
jgi:uncharacterized protein YcgI (DUF1989 family)